MQPTEKISEVISEMHALIQFMDGSEDARMEAMKCELTLDFMSDELSSLTRYEITEATRRGVQRVTKLAYA